MKITITNLGKKFSSDWIFKGIDASFQKGQVISVIGSNGSGKSTFLKIVSGSELSSKGKIQYHLNGREINAENIFREVNYCAPYVDLPEELTIKEIYNFHNQFKTIELDFKKFAQLIWLENQTNKSIKNFSSGMKQRLKLALAFLSKSEVLFLDEPTSNLDEKGKMLYLSLLELQAKHKLIFIGTNSDLIEMKHSNQTLNIMDYKS